MDEDMDYLRQLTQEVGIEIQEEIHMQDAKKSVKAGHVDSLIDASSIVLFVTRHLVRSHLIPIMEKNPHLETISLGFSCVDDVATKKHVRYNLLPIHKIYHKEQMQEFLTRYVLKNVA
jgi:hypothetical protein